MLGRWTNRHFDIHMYVQLKSCTIDGNGRKTTLLYTLKIVWDWGEMLFNTAALHVFPLTVAIVGHFAAAHTPFLKAMTKTNTRKKHSKCGKSRAIIRESQNKMWSMYVQMWYMQANFATMQHATAYNYI